MGLKVFISDQAFPGEALVDEAKMGILAASMVAGAAGYTVLRFALRRR